MASYTVAAKELEGVILYFCPHHEAFVPVIRHTFNAVYGIDLYETDFHFIFKDVPKNGLTEWYKDAPERLLNYMITHIKSKSRATLRTGTEKVKASFGTMQLSYQMSNGKIVNFK